MEQKVISVAHSLVLWPVADVLSFSVLTIGVSMQRIGNGYKLDITPGSLTISDKVDGDGIYSKKYTFKVPRPDKDVQSKLRMLSAGGLYVATYKDDNGRERVAGSPSYPLSLSYEYSGGLMNCTLQGKGVDADPYTL